MGYKMVPQITGLVRDEPKEGQKHRANGKAILGELGNERHSASLTLDPSRSHLNEYDGFGGSGFACWDALEDAADAFRVKVNTKNGVRERKLPPDSVIGWAMIANPPAEMTVGWDAAMYARFFDDTLDVIGEIVPDVFRRENVRMTALHKDEGYMDETGEYGWNWHVVGVPVGRNGRYCGNLIDAKRCVEICQDFPRLMRARGWDLDDLDMTDFSRMGKDENGEYKDPAYREERKAKRKEQGRKTNKYIADKKAKAAEMAAQAYKERQAAHIEAAMERHEANELRAQVDGLKQVAGGILSDAMDAAQAEREDARKYAKETRRGADDYAFRVRRHAMKEATETEAQAAEDAEAIQEAARQEAQEIKAQAEREAQEARERVAAMLRDAQADRDAARDVLGTAKTEARNVLQQARMDAKTLKQSGYEDGFAEGEEAAQEAAKGVMEAARKKGYLDGYEAGVREGSSTPRGRLAELRARDSLDDILGPSTVEGPKM